ncbi:hypothetical protein [Archangium lansingense]|uniref:Uncharacterized protein n=1 Tax=Archangium lansingense TaxID=2995310 RepID=A0ABT4AJZ5_9BACT|nr:hypothetical protein [Archangium lansinium]MCY1082017.1 hypothetical protein [Archangium lansinium]
MKNSGTRTRRTLGLAGFLLVLVAALGAQAEPPSSKLPGRKPDSKEPWGAFLGKAAHYAIGKEYSVRHPTHIVFLDESLSTIVGDGKLGNPKRLSELVRRLRPDITDIDAFVLFELKPDNEASRVEGRDQAGRYLAALNEVAEPDKKLVGGTGFEGALFLEFENGGALWQLSWRTSEPGVTLYRWSYRRKQPGASWKERAAQKEEELPREEVEQRGEMAEQAIRAAYDKGERPKGFQGQVYLPVDCR